MQDPRQSIAWIFAGADKATGKYKEGESFYLAPTEEKKARASDILQQMERYHGWPAGVAASGYGCPHVQ